MEDTKTRKVIVNVILDRSGSMSTSRATAISGYNEYIQGLRAETEAEYSVSLIQFDAPLTTPELTVSYEDRALADVPELTRETYVPRGNTPLYDAIGECVRRLDAKGRGVVVLVITDGEENASTEFTKESVKAMIQEKEKEGWTFAFLGANIDSYAVGGGVGVRASNISNYQVGNEQQVFRSAAAATNNRARAYRLHGVHAAVSMSFIDDAQRHEMEGKPAPQAAASAPLSSSSTGGRPAAPSSFPRKRDWKVTS